MQLPLQSFSALIGQMAAGVQGAATQLIDLSIGSVLRAVLEACAAVALWMQWLILQVLTMTRAATSVGPDLDSWMADFSLTRLPGAAATGIVIFSRYTGGIATTVPVGAVVQTSDGSQNFTVVASPGYPNWNGTNGYTLAATAASVSAPVQAVTVGAAGNVQAGTITILTTAIPAVDTVSNAQPFSGGGDAETDAALRARFQLYINSRSLATTGAVLFAIASVPHAVRYVVFENQDAAGDGVPGNFAVTVDDGTGYPSLQLLSQIQAAINNVRPIGSIFSVLGPTVVYVSVSLTLETNNAATLSAVEAAAQASIAAWIAGLPIGGTLAISKIDALAHAVDASVISVLNVTINGSAADITAPAAGVLLPLSVRVN
jgi:uncharacterized phage protein gp47/JayE